MVPVTLPINVGIYKSEDKHLFELTLTDIEQIYACLNRVNHHKKERV
ncbi:Fur-regulated basic protein FbpA [Halalkalibacter alkaliphilus]